MNQARTALGYLAVIFAVLLIPQFYFAGAMAFSGLADGTEAHQVVGGVMSLISLIILVLALVTRTHLPLAAGLFGLMVLQNVLAVIGTEGSDWIGALHAVNALLVAGAAGSLAHRSGVGRGRGRAGATSRVA